MAVQDDEDRFGAIMLPHMDAAYSLARYLTRNPSSAEDIVQESYLRAYRGFAGWRGQNPKAWLLTIVRRCFLDAISRVDPLGEEHEGPVPETATEDGDAETVVDEQRRAALLRDAIEALPRPYRETIILRELEELGYREVAAIVGVPIGTVMSRLSRGRRMLADRLEQLERAEAAPMVHEITLDA